MIRAHPRRMSTRGSAVVIDGLTERALRRHPLSQKDGIAVFALPRSCGASGSLTPHCVPHPEVVIGKERAAGPNSNRGNLQARKFGGPSFSVCEPNVPALESSSRHRQHSESPARAGLYFLKRLETLSSAWSTMPRASVHDRTS